MGFIAPRLITLTGTPSKLDPVVIRPNGAGALTELTPSAGNNWECVDETIKDDDTTYVETHAISTCSDLYTTPIQSHVGTITSIKVYSYAKSDLNSPSIAAEYQLLISDDNGVNIGESDTFNLSTDYVQQQYTWFTNPRTGLDWDWGDVDNLQIGVACSSPSIFDFPTNIIFRPNGAGTYTELDPHPVVANYANIDEVVPDYNSTIVEVPNKNVYYKDSYTMPSHTTETGTINSVTVWAVCCKTQYTAPCYAKVLVYIGGTLSYSPEFTLPFSGGSSGWLSCSHTWTENPDTSSPWTWDDIDNLEIGIALKSTIYNTIARCTQVYVVINYDKNYINPEMRTTQVYAEINSTITPCCSLPSPIDIQIDQQIDTKGLNFWSGNREVYAQGRNSKRTNLSGLMWDGCTDGTTTCEDLIACVRQLGKYQNPMSITGLRYNDLNTDYNIISFGWKRLYKRPNCYAWNLELEFCD
jgi:hypothetical protein